MDLRNQMKKARFQLPSLNQFSIGVMWNIVSLGILGLGGLLLSLLVVRFEGAEAVGVFNQVYAIYIILSQIGVGGLQFSVLKHVSHNQKDDTACSDITIAAFLLTIILGSVLSVLTYLMADLVGNWLQSAEVGLGLKMAAPGILFFSLNKMLLNVINGRDSIRAVATLRALRTIFLVVSVFIMLWLNESAGILCVAFTLTEIILLPIFLVFIVKKLFPLRFTPGVWSWIKPHISFGLRGMMSGVLIELNTRVDVIMLGYFSSDTIVGIYSFVSILAESFSQIPLALRTSVDPLMGGFFAEKKIDDINHLVSEIKRKYYPLILAGGFLLVLLYPALHYFWVADNQLVMNWATLTIIMVGVIFNAAYRPFGGILLQGGRPGVFTFLITVLIVSDAMLNLLFIPLWGIYGAAAVTCFTYSLEAVLLIVVARRLFGVKL